MDYYGKILIEHLNTDKNKEHRTQLYNLLNADINDIFVYYFVPLSNLISIVNSGGIKCRNNLNIPIDDLSGQSVQSKRKRNSRKLTLAAKHSGHSDIKKDIHQCVNFFINPINYTFVAFQRKALFNSYCNSNELDRPVCILEISLKEFFNKLSYKWCISEKNLASDYFTTFSEKMFSKYNWALIYKHQSDKNSNSFQSSEFVVFKGNQNNSDTIPYSLINRIILREDDLNMFNENLPQFNEKYEINNSLFANYGYLLYPVKKLLEQIIYLDKSGFLPIDKLVDILIEYRELSSKLDFYITKEKFSSEFMAFSHHGIGHTTRVVFLVQLLNSINNVNDEKSICSIYSALIHDLGKSNNVEDEKHGSSSVAKYNSFLQKRILDKNCLISCLNAIHYHSIDDNKCPEDIQDLTWKTLKDADALDRGRFAQPNSKSGCNVKFLRLDIFKNNQNVSNQLSWFAYNLATITRHTFWNKDTCQDLVKSVSNWILTYANFSNTSIVEDRIIEKIRTL